MIQVIDRVFHILELLRCGHVLGLGSLAKRTGLNKSTLCNILKSMMELGYVSNDGNGNYSLSEKFRNLALPMPQEKLLSEQCMHFCKELAETTKESGVIATLRRNRIAILAQAQYPRNLVISMSIYEDLSIYHSVSGRIIVAFLTPEERDEIIDIHGFPEESWDGISTHRALEETCAELRRMQISVMENQAEGIKAFAVPVFDAEKRICGAAGLTVPLFRLGNGAEETILARLKECAAVLAWKNAEFNLNNKIWRMLENGDQQSGEVQG